MAKCVGVFVPLTKFNFMMQYGSLPVVANHETSSDIHQNTDSTNNNSYIYFGEALLINLVCPAAVANV